ncbi:asparagine synthase (glutamine-hydrolyzing) [Ekhidna sp. To15]|uniref:asparagine synthase (glutamine-hydrolyzing) n=1 Tax=Ekhidna sp. To15 TaxID=3395267 RepID=UPI003F52907E
MCGITGFKNFSNRSDLANSLKKSTDSLNRRGPDFQATYLNKSIGLGHTRLSIIDTSSRANQPMSDQSGRYTLVFNGEIYNFQELAKDLSIDFKSSSDTEVLLYLLINEGHKCLEKLNGFFAFAFYDSKDETLLIARDRMGIKPLHYFQSGEFFAFGSELKAIFSYPIPRKINKQSLYAYLQFTYLPGEMSMILGVKKLLPGHFIKIENQTVSVKPFFTIDQPKLYEESYENAQDDLVKLFEESVRKRMIADVPLGAFLSGGTDSSAVVSMASKFNENLSTFSIGYSDHPFFDETHFAESVANKFKTNHTTFSLTNNDLLNSLDDIMTYIDEPFADSSAIPTYILSQRVSNKMKVALSGDGADELFGGYYKHLAFHKSQKRTITNALIKSLSPLLSALPKSRSTSLGNTSRRLAKYGELLRLSSTEKYWHLASFNTDPSQFLHGDHSEALLHLIHSTHPQDSLDLNGFLDSDLRMVLPGDMLTKVDLMSMANSLEVRVPFLDKDLVAFARSLPADYKVRGNHRKRVLQDAFQHILPKELHHRSKKGFEVPMLHWLRNELSSEVDQIVFNEAYLESQGIFVKNKVLSLRNKLYSNSPEDVHATIWTLYVFQRWYKKWIE